MSQIPLTANYQLIGSAWSAGYQIEVEIKNTSSTKVTSWNTSFVIPANEFVGSFWNAVMLPSVKNPNDGTTKVTFGNPSWGATIDPQQSVTVGLIVNSQGLVYPNLPDTNITNLSASGTIAGDGGSNPPPPPPLPLAPVLNNVSQTNPNSFTVSWNVVADATTYVLQVFVPDDNNLQQANNATFVPSTEFTLDSQTVSKSFQGVSNNSYFFRVKAVNSVGSSEFSNVKAISINVIAPNPPVLSAISNSSGSNSFTVQWSVVNNAQSYSLEEASSSAFSDSRVLFTGTPNSFNVSNRPLGTLYYRVFVTVNGVKSSQSNVVSTSVTQAPSFQLVLEGYWESWNFNSTPQAIVNMKANVIVISFATFTSNGGNVYEISGVESDAERLNQLVSAAHLLGKKVKIAIGGATYGMSFFLTSSAAAVGMAQAIQKYVKANNLDGVDFDIEDHPQTSLQIQFIQETRKALPPPYIITYTSATPASTTSPFKDVILGAISSCDWINLMAYDFGPGYTYQQDVINLMQLGIPASKIVVGFMPGRDDVGFMTSVTDIETASKYILQQSLRGIMLWDLNRDLENTTGLGSAAATNKAAQVLHL